MQPGGGVGCDGLRALQAGPLVTAPLIGFVAATPPIVLGSPWSIAYRATPTTPMLILWSDRVEPRAVSPVMQPVWMPPAMFEVAAVGLSDAAGLLTFTTVVPATPSLLHATFHVPSVAGTILPLQAAPTVGGVVR